jgi:transposase
MAVAYSMDLRSRVLRDADAGLTSKALAARYHVSRAWVDALKQRRRETGDPAPRKQTRWRRPILAGQEGRLKALLLEQPDRTLRELREALGTSASLATIWRAVDRIDFTVKKRHSAPRNTTAPTWPRPASGGGR